MTIKDVAEKYGISSQAIYQRLKKYKIDIESLKDKETGELTADAEGVMAQLFANKSNQRKPTLQSEMQSLRALVDSYEKENSVLRAKLESAERELETVKSTLEVERAMVLRLLPPPRESFFDRLRKKRRTE